MQMTVVTIATDQIKDWESFRGGTTHSTFHPTPMFATFTSTLPSRALEAVK